MLSFAAKRNKFKDMKTKLFLISLFVFLIMSSCKKLDEFTKFHLKYDTEYVLPLVLSTNGVLITYPEPLKFATNSDAFFEENNTSADLIEEVHIDEAYLEVKESETINFSFLNEVQFWLIDEENSVVKDSVLLASKVLDESIDTQKLDLDVTDKDLSQYITKDSLSFKIKLETDENIFEEIKLNIHTDFEVNAKILGI